jgi:thiamine monophosphate synthase
MLDRFYPIVPDCAWLRIIVPLGVKTVQLRAKDIPPEQLSREIAEGLAICREHGCQLIVNDYWREAIDLGADYIHLGQGAVPRRPTARGRPRVRSSSSSPPVPVEAVTSWRGPFRPSSSGTN